MTKHGFLDFMKKAFSENGSPSSSRIVGAWLSVSSMALIWWMVRHAMVIGDAAQMATWVGSMPAIIYALAAFSVSPYTVAKITGIWSKDNNPLTTAPTQP